MSSDQTVASIIMTSGGSTIGILGTLLSSLSSLYIIKNISTSGCSAVECLPMLIDNKYVPSQTNTNQEVTDKKSQQTLWKKTDNALKYIGIDIKNYFVLGMFLGTGVLAKKIGTLLTDPHVISHVEKFVYRGN